MGFVREESCTRTVNELQEKDWKYLNELGIRTMLGEKIGPAWSNLVVDREKNYYLISQGCTNPNRDNRRIYYYALCLDGKVLNMEVSKKESGNAREKSFECHWKIEKIEFPTGWTFDNVSKNELITIIRGAFMVEYYSNVCTPERTKALTVEILAPLEVNI